MIISPGTVVPWGPEGIDFWAETPSVNRYKVKRSKDSFFISEL